MLRPVKTGPGLLFVVSGPSGAGKDTLVDALRARTPRLRYSVSATTRSPREGEVEGQHYFFLSEAEFVRRRDAGEFLEWRVYNSNLYGTPRDYVEQTVAEGYDMVMKPEVNGALAVQAAYPAAVLIFLVPDKLSYLRDRLLARRTETNEEIASRLETAHQEMKFIRSFDYLVINEQHRSEEAVEDLAAVLHAERFRIHRYSDDRLRRVEHT
jgi:guanylate kinase